MTKKLSPRTLSIFALLTLFSPSVFAEEIQGTSAIVLERPLLEKVGDYVGLTYFSFFDGPGVGEPIGLSPGPNGRPIDTGLGVWTNLSVRLKVTQRLAVDYQFRLQQIFTNEWEFRNQGGRLGVSGTFFKVGDWEFKGALNTDIPGVGQIPTERTLIANPGFFAQLSYRPSGSRWSMFSMVRPRVSFYRSNSAMAVQDEQQNLPAGAKPQIALEFNPSANYAISEKHGLRAGITVDYRKNAIGSFNRWFWPVDLGYTYTYSSWLSFYPHMRFSTPLDNGLRETLASARGRSADPWTHTMSVGLWVHGTIL